MELQLIKLVKQRPILYDKNNRSHKCLRLRKKNWREIALKMGVNVMKLKSRWRSLRDSYIKEKKTERNVKWKYFNLLRFLDDGQPGPSIDTEESSRVNNSEPYIQETSFHLTDVNNIKTEEPTPLPQQNPNILLNLDERPKQASITLTPTMAFFQFLAILVENENLSFLRFSTLQTRVLSIVHDEIWKHRQERQHI